MTEQKRKIRKRVYRDIKNKKYYTRKGKNKLFLKNHEPKKKVFRSSRKQLNQKEKPQTKEQMIKDYLIAKKEKVILADIISNYQQKIEKYKQQENDEKVKEYQEKQDKMLQKIQKKEQVILKDEQDNISLSVPVKREKKEDEERNNMHDIVEVLEEEVEEKDRKIQENAQEYKESILEGFKSDLDQKFQKHMSEQEVQDYTELIEKEEKDLKKREQKAQEFMKTFINLKPTGEQGSKYKKALTKDIRQLQKEDIDLLYNRMPNPHNYADQHRDEGILFLKQLKLIQKGNQHFDEIKHLQKQIQELEGNGIQDGNDKSMILQTMIILINQIIYSNPQYSISQQVIISFDQKIQQTDAELQIILFLTPLEQSRHYTVAVINKVKEPNEIVYYDPLALNKPEIIKTIKQAALQQFPDEYVKFKVNTVQIQDGEEPGLYKDSWYMCGQFCYLFLVEYLGVNFHDPGGIFDFKKATMYKGLSEEQKEKLREITIKYNSTYRKGFSEL